MQDGMCFCFSIWSFDDKSCAAFYTSGTASSAKRSSFRRPCVLKPSAGELFDHSIVPRGVKIRNISHWLERSVGNISLHDLPGGEQAF